MTTLPACVLNVDDDPSQRYYRTTVLQAAGFTVREADSGFAALAALEDELPDVILLDVNLPGLNGFEVCRRVRADARTARIPVLHISGAWVTNDDWAYGLEVGADNYLIEPVAPEVLVGTIRLLVHRQRSEAEAHRERADAMEALRASEQRYRGLFMHAPYGIYTVTAAGLLLQANKALAKTLGYESVAAIAGMNVRDCFDKPADHDAIVADWSTPGAISSREVVWRSRDRQPLIVRLTGRAVFDCHITLFEVFVEDLTDSRRVEAEMRQALKMDGIGRLAAGIAHDFNNLLTGILGYTELMLEQIDPTKPIYADLCEVQKAGQSAAALTHQLLAFSRKQTLHIVVVDINDVVRAMEQLLRRLIGDTVKIVVTLGADSPRLKADPVQLEQVIVNLAVNARDAMPDGGMLVIETSTVRLPSDYSFPMAAKVTPGTYVKVSVQDTGVGMDVDTQANLFEPFFSTKKQGRGTGLGLATVYGIVKQLGGFIWVDSEPGHGSTFTLFFPATADEVARPNVASRDAVDVGNETILVVEDEQGVRALASAVLTRHGYRVLEAESAERGLAMFSEAGQAIDLILTDVVMPGMNGPTMVKQIEPAERPPVMYMSGYAGSVTHKLLDEGAVILAKPFKHGELLAHVRRVLSERPAAASTGASRASGTPAPDATLS